MITDRDITHKLAALRDGWLASIGDTGLIPGPFLTSDEIRELETSTGWSGLHLAEAVRRAFSPFDSAALAELAGDVPEVEADNTSKLLAILAGRVPALAAKVLFHGLCAGVGVILKPSSAEPVFARLLVKSMNAVAPEVPVSHAPTGRLLLDELVKAAPLCLVYGSDETVASVLAARPALPTLTGPHMESFAIVFASALTDDAAARAIAYKIALDTAIYDQSGCLSPVAGLVQSGGTITTREFAGYLLESLIKTPLKTGAYRPELLAPVRLFLQESSLLYGRDAVLTGPDGIPPAVIMSDVLRPSPGMRTIQVIEFQSNDDPASRPPDLTALLPGLQNRIQGISIATGSPGDALTESAETAALLAANPAFRPNYLCAPGFLQDPPALWPENGIVLASELRRLI